MSWDESMEPNSTTSWSSMWLKIVSIALLFLSSQSLASVLDWAASSGSGVGVDVVPSARMVANGL